MTIQVDRHPLISRLVTCHDENGKATMRGEIVGVMSWRRGGDRLMVLNEHDDALIEEWSPERCSFRVAEPVGGNLLSSKLLRDLSDGMTPCPACGPPKLTRSGDYECGYSCPFDYCYSCECMDVVATSVPRAMRLWEDELRKTT